MWRKRQTWDGRFTFQKRRSGLADWFVVVGNLRLWMEACWTCGRPCFRDFATHYTDGKIPEAHVLRSWLEENDVDTSRQFPYCTICAPDIVYDSGGSGPGVPRWSALAHQPRIGK
jgi:hypothetical protein